MRAEAVIVWIKDSPCQCLFLLNSFICKLSPVLCCFSLGIFLCFLPPTSFSFFLLCLYSIFVSFIPSTFPFIFQECFLIPSTFQYSRSPIIRKLVSRIANYPDRQLSGSPIIRIANYPDRFGPSSKSVENSTKN